MATYIVQCGSCGAENRVPGEKEGVAGRCGNCKNPLPPLYLEPQKGTEATFDLFLREYPGPVVAEFWAPW